MNDVRIRIVSIGAAILILLFVIELVRRRRLKEEYSVLWIGTALVLLVLAVWFELLVWITELIGGVAPTSTLFFFGLLFVVLVLLHFSVRISTLERQFTAMVQEIGMLTLESQRATRPEDDPLLEAPDRVTMP